MLRRAWNSLALVPVASGGTTFELGKALSELGAVFGGRPVRLLSGVDLTLDSLAQFIDTMVRLAKKGGGGTSNDDQRVVVVLNSVVNDPLGVAVALAADAVLLVVELGKSDIESARRTIDLIGSERFIGSVTIRRP